MSVDVGQLVIYVTFEELTQKVEEILDWGRRDVGAVISGRRRDEWRGVAKRKI